MLPTDDRSIQHRAILSNPTSLHFIPVEQVSPYQPPENPVTTDVFQLAPFKMAGKEKAFNTSSFCASHKPSEPADVFLQAPFKRRQESTRAAPTNAYIPGAQLPGQIQPSKHHQKVPVLLLAAPQARTKQDLPLHSEFTERPLMQQPVAVHRVVSRIGQQAAIGSVAVGPLHSWTIGGKSLKDPFTAAPFQPRYSQGKP
ncbi:hypothetical protein LDENG_00145090 [Lucifuga dentata]|nr:hypothetical protein LDENG_00145090 [Lucifuga dentata]